MAVNVDQVNFNSQWLYFKQSASGTSSVTFPGVGGLVPVQLFTVNHNLGYNPNALIYHSIDNTNWHLGGHDYPGVNFHYDFLVTPYTTTTHIAMELSPIATDGSASWDDDLTLWIRYKIYIDSSD